MKESRAKRRKIKVKLVQEDYANLPHDKEYGNEWASPRDGKHWVRNIDYKILKK